MTVTAKAPVIKKKLKWRDVKCLICHKHRRGCMTTIDIFDGHVRVPICPYCILPADIAQQCEAILLKRFQEEPAFFHGLPLPEKPNEYNVPVDAMSTLTVTR